MALYNPQPQSGTQQRTGYGPNPGVSGTDPRGRAQNQQQYQQQRYESQQGPLASAMAQNYGRGSEADYGNYTDIMNQYRNLASTSGGSTGGGYGGGGYSAFTVDPERVTAERATSRSLNPLERVTASNPYKSYEGYQEFGQTGGYSPQDMANMRARGIAPIRAAYDAAARNIGQQRSLQGGYAPNAIAAQVKMAREQGQGMSDAAQNVEAGIAQARNQGRLAGYGGMAGIEGNNQQAQMQADMYNSGQAFQGQQFDIGNEMNTSQFNAGQANNMGQFNADLNFKGQTYNADAQRAAQASNNAASANAAYQTNADRFRALEGMTNLYGTTPGMSNMFGNQATNIVGQGGNMGANFMNAEQGNAQIPGQYDQTTGRITDALNLFGTASNAVYPFLNRGQQQTPPPTQVNRGTFNPSQFGRQYPMSQPPPPSFGISPSFDPSQYGQQYPIGTPPPYNYGGY